MGSQLILFSGVELESVGGPLISDEGWEGSLWLLSNLQSFFVFNIGDSVCCRYLIKD